MEPSSHESGSEGAIQQNAPSLQSNLEPDSPASSLELGDSMEFLSATEIGAQNLVVSVSESVTLSMMEMESSQTVQSSGEEVESALTAVATTRDQSTIGETPSLQADDSVPQESSSTTCLNPLAASFIPSLESSVATLPSDSKSEESDEPGPSEKIVIRDEVKDEIETDEKEETEIVEETDNPPASADSTVREEKNDGGDDGVEKLVSTVAEVPVESAPVKSEEAEIKDDIIIFQTVEILEPVLTDSKLRGESPPLDAGDLEDDKELKDVELSNDDIVDDDEGDDAGAEAQADVAGATLTSIPVEVAASVDSLNTTGTESPVMVSPPLSDDGGARTPKTSQGSEAGNSSGFEMISSGERSPVEEAPTIFPAGSSEDETIVDVAATVVAAEPPIEAKTAEADPDVSEPPVDSAIDTPAEAPLVAAGEAEAIVDATTAVLIAADVEAPSVDDSTAGTIEVPGPIAEAPAATNVEQLVAEAVESTAASTVAASMEAPAEPTAEDPVTSTIETPVQAAVEIPTGAAITEEVIVSAVIAEAPVSASVGDAAPVAAAAEIPVAETSVAETPVAETPVAETPIAETPIAEMPATEIPVAATLVAESPTAEMPIVATPNAELLVATMPVAEMPVAELPVTAIPVVETPIVETPIVETPVAQTPVAVMPVAETPVTDAEEKPKSEATAEEPEWEDILGSGTLMKKTVIMADEAGARPTPGQVVSIMTEGKLEDGTQIDLNEKLEFTIGDHDVVQALEIITRLLRVGEVVEVKTDPKFAYGKLGRAPDVPPDARIHYVVALLDINPPLEFENMPPSKRLSHGSAKKERGNVLFKREEYSQAIVSYTKAVKVLDADSGGSGDSAGTPTELQKLLDEKMKVYNNLAATQMKLLAYDSAIKSCDAVIKLQPNNVKALFRKGQALESKKDTAEALVYFKRSLKLDPNSKRIKQDVDRLSKVAKQQEDKEKKLYAKMLGTTEAPKQEPKKESVLGHWASWFGSWAIAVAGTAALVGFTVVAVKSLS